MRMYRIAGVAVVVLVALGSSSVALGYFGGHPGNWWNHYRHGHHEGRPEEVKPPGVTGTWGDIVNFGPPPTPTEPTAPSGNVREPLPTVNGYSEERTHTVTPPNVSMFAAFPGVVTMEGHEEITHYEACLPAGSPFSACQGKEAAGTMETAALDECNPCTVYDASGNVIGTGSIAIPWWDSGGHSVHQHVGLLMHGTGALRNLHGVLTHPLAGDPRCAAGHEIPHYVGCWTGTVHQDACISGDWHGPLRVAPGQSACILPGGRVFGPTSIGKDGELFAEGATFYGPISSDEAEAFSLCTSAVLGSVSVTETTGPVMIGSPETHTCGGNFIQGALSVEHNGCSNCDANGGDTGAVEISGDTVLGSLRSSDNVGAYVVGYFVPNNIFGSITEEGNS